MTDTDSWIVTAFIIVFFLFVVAVFVMAIAQRLTRRSPSRFGRWMRRLKEWESVGLVSDDDNEGYYEWGSKEQSTLEEMCQASMRQTLHESKRLSPAEYKILSRKHLWGKSAFPISAFVDDKQIKHWLKDPEFNSQSLFLDDELTKVASKTPVDVRTIQRILRKAYCDSYKSVYNAAKFGAERNQQEWKQR